MSDNMRNILITAGTIILVAIIFSITFAIFNKGKDSVNATSGTIDQYLTAGIDSFEVNQEVQGSVVITSIQGLKTSDGSYSITVNKLKADGSTESTYTYQKDSVADYKTKSSAYYINPTQTYVVKSATPNADGIITSIVFERK